ncbi:MAG: RelA/SpoT family protein [Ignavibacteria bacterium]
MFTPKNKKRLDDLLAQCRKNFPGKKINENLITNAYRFAVEAHKNDKRASGEEYITHPYEVAMILAKEIPVDDTSVACGLLHDVVEDTKFSINDIRAEFGDIIAEIVDGATQIEGLSENYELKQIESYKKLVLSMTSDIRVMLVKFADRLHNLRTLGFLSSARQFRMAQETLEIYAPLAHRFGLSTVKSELEDLAFKYLDRKAYEEIAKKISEKKRERERFIKRFTEPIKKALEEANLKAEVYGRPKHFYSIYKKIKSQGKSLDEIYDLFAVRVILESNNPNDCFLAQGIISQLYFPISERFKDYISKPKQNNYQSLHITVMSKEGRPVEVQIRTRQMHEIAEKGIAAHWKYKENVKLNDEKIESWVKSIRETIENATQEGASSDEIFESFKLNLYQDEIYCFTPKGDLKVLPVGATPVDFAFEIHSEVGMRCIGAKVNGRIVPLNTKLKSGCQVEIITSKNSRPKRDWEKFVVTNKARFEIRKFFNTERREQIAKGKEVFEKKLKKLKLHITPTDLETLFKKFHIKSEQEFFIILAKDESKMDVFLDFLANEKIEGEQTQESIEGPEIVPEKGKYEKFVKQARSTTQIVLPYTSERDSKDIKYEFAKCCNPIPGDDVIGFITQTEGIKVHRKSCKNIANLFLQNPNRIVDINWGTTAGGIFKGGIKIIGEDKPGILSRIAKLISDHFKLNIQNLNINTKGSMFEGIIILEVQNLVQLNAVIEKINSEEGILKAERFSG